MSTIPLNIVQISNSFKMSDLESESDVPELSTAQRIKLAFQRWTEANGKESIKGCARKHGVSYSTLYGQIHRAKSKKEVS